MRDVIIAPQSEGKGRSFLATCLASVVADPLWKGGEADTDMTRPIWAMFAGSDMELRPFMANLALGKKAIPLGADTSYSRRRIEGKMEFLRSSRYQIVWQREDEGSVATIFLPELFRMDPGMVDPSGIRFVLMPPSAWAANEAVDRASIVRFASRLGHPVPVKDLGELVPLAYLFGAYLDRRTRCPIPADGRFHMQLLLSCLKLGLASWPLPETLRHEKPFGQNERSRFYATGIAEVGMERALVFNALHEDFEAILALEVSLFFDRIKGGV